MSILKKWIASIRKILTALKDAFTLAAPQSKGRLSDEQKEYYQSSHNFHP